MIRMKIAFALRLVDDYSGKDIRKNSFLFFIGERVVHPIEKENGLYIFLEPQEAVTRIHLEGPDYHACTVQVEKKLLSQEEPVAVYGCIESPAGAAASIWKDSFLRKTPPSPERCVSYGKSPQGLPSGKCGKSGKNTGFCFRVLPGRI